MLGIYYFYYFIINLYVFVCLEINELLDFDVLIFYWGFFGKLVVFLILLGDGMLVLEYSIRRYGVGIK